MSDDFGGLPTMAVKKPRNCKENWSQLQNTDSSIEELMQYLRFLENLLFGALKYELSSSHNSKS